MFSSRTRRIFVCWAKRTVWIAWMKWWILTKKNWPKIKVNVSKAKAVTLRNDCQVPLIFTVYTHTYRSQNLAHTFESLLLLRHWSPEIHTSTWWYPSSRRRRNASLGKYIGNKTFGSSFFMLLVSKEKPLETWAPWLTLATLSHCFHSAKIAFHCFVFRSFVHATNIVKLIK